MRDDHDGGVVEPVEVVAEPGDASDIKVVGGFVTGVYKIGVEKCFFGFMIMVKVMMWMTIYIDKKLC